MGAVWGKITSSVCKCDAKPPASSNNSSVPGAAPNMPRPSNNNRPKNNNRSQRKNDPKYTGN